MYIVTTMVWPFDKTKEVAEMYLKAMAKYPDDPGVASPVVPSGLKATLEGMSSLVIYEVKKGKLDEAYIIAVNRMLMFNTIQGVKYTTEVRYTLEEAMKSIGM